MTAKQVIATALDYCGISQNELARRLEDQLNFYLSECRSKKLR